MIKKLAIALGVALGLTGITHAEVYKLDPKSTQCYLFSHDKLQQKLACNMTATAATGKVWWTKRNFKLANEKTIKTFAKDTQRKYLSKTDKILMPFTSELDRGDDQISIATINNQPAIRQNRWLKDYRVMNLEEFWGNHNQLLPNQMTDRLACLQLENKSFEICTPYNHNDFRTD